MLADSVMMIVEAMVQQTDERSSETSTVLQDILKTAADEQGHWDLPLTAAQWQAMQQVCGGGCDDLALLCSTSGVRAVCKEQREQIVFQG